MTLAHSRSNKIFDGYEYRPSKSLVQVDVRRLPATARIVDALAALFTFEFEVPPKFFDMHRDHDGLKVKFLYYVLYVTIFMEF